MHGINQRDISRNRDESSQNAKGFVKLYSYGEQNDTNYMVMELMGPSLADLYQFCG